VPWTVNIVLPFTSIFDNAPNIAVARKVLVKAIAKAANDVSSDRRQTPEIMIASTGNPLPPLNFETSRRTSAGR